MRSEEIIESADREELVVYNQWTIDSITKFIDRVRNHFKYQIDVYQESEDFNWNPSYRYRHIQPLHINVYPTITFSSRIV